MDKMFLIGGAERKIFLTGSARANESVNRLIVSALEFHCARARSGIY